MSCFSLQTQLLVKQITNSAVSYDDKLPAWLTYKLLTFAPTNIIIKYYADTPKILQELHEISLNDEQNQVH